MNARRRQRRGGICAAAHALSLPVHAGSASRVGGLLGKGGIPWLRGVGVVVIPVPGTAALCHSGHGRRRRVDCTTCSSSMPAHDPGTRLHSLKQNSQQVEPPRGAALPPPPPLHWPPPSAGAAAVLHAHPLSLRVWSNTASAMPSSSLNLRGLAGMAATAGQPHIGQGSHSLQAAGKASRWEHREHMVLASPLRAAVADHILPGPLRVVLLHRPRVLGHPGGGQFMGRVRQWVAGNQPGAGAATGAQWTCPATTCECRNGEETYLPSEVCASSTTRMSWAVPDRSLSTSSYDSLQKGGEDGIKGEAWPGRQQHHRPALLGATRRT